MAGFKAINLESLQRITFPYALLILLVCLKATNHISESQHTVGCWISILLFIGEILERKYVWKLRDHTEDMTSKNILLAVRLNYHGLSPLELWSLANIGLKLTGQVEWPWFWAVSPWLLWKLLWLYQIYLIRKMMLIRKKNFDSGAISPSERDIPPLVIHKPNIPNRSGSCPSCGESAGPGAAFCGNCGQRL